VGSLSEEMEKLERDYYDLTRASKISSLEFVKISQKNKPKHLNEIVNNPINIKERVNWLERRMDDIEKTLVLINKNIDETKRNLNEKLDKMKHHKEIPPEIKNELSSLKSLVERTMNVNQEIKTKLPEFLRELEGKVKTIDEEVKKLKEEDKEYYLNRPIILE